MDRREKMLQRLRTTKWLLPAGFAVLTALSAASIGLVFLSGLARLEPDWIFNIGADIIGIAVCAVLYYGCMSGKDNEEETTYLFVALLSTNGFALFLDECAWLVQGVAALRVWNIAVNVLFYANGIVLLYQFWRYVRAALGLEDAQTRFTTATLQIVLIPAILACFANFFAPVYFSVDGMGVYQREALYPLAYLYALLCTVFLIVGLVHSNAPKRQKSVVISFVTVPILNAILTFGTFGISTQYVATLISIVLIYSVLFSDRSKSLAATQSELSLASSIQADMLPNIFPAFPERKEFDLFATMEPAKEVGGDFYDFFMIGEDRLCMVVADVSGKGVPAALFSMIAKTLLKMQAETWSNPEYVLQKTNALLSENNKESMFVTVWLGVLEISTGELTYADAGHEKLLLYQSGEWKFLPKKGGPALAMLEPEDLEMLGDKSLFHNQTVQLKPGDAIFQYTDGVTEATDATNELFGDERLLSAMNSAPTAKPEELLLHIRNKINEFVKDAEQFDDITMLGFQYKGADLQTSDGKGL